MKKGSPAQMSIICLCTSLYIFEANAACVSLKVCDEMTILIHPVHKREGFLAKRLWRRFGSCCLLHGSVAHLLINMWGLYHAGANLEGLCGKARILCVYAAGGIICTSLLEGSISSNAYQCVGASGKRLSSSTAIFSSSPLPAARRAALSLAFPI